MNILDARVDWYLGWRNHPVLEILVYEIPNLDNIVYYKKENMYWGEMNGLVHFLLEDPNDHSGFGGTNWPINLTDGSTKILKGPWSSRAGVMNKHFPTSFPVNIYIENNGKWSQYSSNEKHITFELALKAAKMAGVSLKLINEIFPGPNSNNLSPQQTHNPNGDVYWIIEGKDKLDNIMAEMSLKGIKLIDSFYNRKELQQQVLQYIKGKL